MNWNGWLWGTVAGLLCGIISGFGIGGGTLLMVWLTAFAGWEQRAAQGLNLLYFLPTAAAALLLHIKNALVDWHTALWAAGAGVITAALSAWLAQRIDTALLRRGFGVFLLFVGLTELLRRPGKTSRGKSQA